MVTLKSVLAVALMLIWIVFLYSQIGTPLSADYCAGYLGSNNRDSVDGIKNTIVDTLFIALNQFSHAVMYIAPYGDPLSTFIIYGTPPPSGMSDLVGDGYSFEYSCNTSQRAYYSIPLLDDHVGYSRDLVTLNVFQANCYGNFESHTFPIWHDGEPYFMKLAHVQYDLPFAGSSYFPDFVENIGVMSDNNAVGWRELDVTNAYNNAISNGWQHFQLMLYFEILTDWDYATDQVLLPNPNYTQYAPHFIVTYNKDVSSDDNVSVPMIYSLSIYPNPFSENATINSDHGYPIDAIELYNLKGQKVAAANYVKQSPIEWKMEFSHKLPAGVYLIRCKVVDGKQERAITKKVMLY